VYDVTSAVSFEHIKYWVNEIKTHGQPECYLILVGNKIDIEDRVIRSEVGQKLAREIGCDFIETSAKDGSNVEELFLTSIKGYLAVHPIYGKNSNGTGTE